MIYNANFLENNLPDQCAQLIIADPPYFETKGDFDFNWTSFQDYLQDVNLWVVECDRLLSKNGTLLWYGSAKKIAYTQIIIDQYLRLLNSCAIEFNRQTKKGVYNFRCLAPVSERLLVYEKGKDSDFNPFKQYLRSNMTEKSTNDVDVALGYVRKKKPTRGTELCRRWCEGSSIPSEKDFNRLKELFGDTETDYATLVAVYEKDKRFFNNSFGLFDIMKFDQEAHITRKYDHDTVKPETLSRRLITTFSREGDMVLVPFAGSGTEMAMAVSEHRRTTGFEIDKKYFDIAKKRILTSDPLF
jgi:DNA modification methylase